jgi:site-specific DNA-methyltransferase (adenine-specific)
MEKYVKVGQAAKLLGVSTETLRRWDKSKKFESVRHPINNYRVYPESNVLLLVEELQLELKYHSSNLLSLEIELFFETKYGKLYQHDAIEFLKTLENESVDLIFADPPHNIKKAERDKRSTPGFKKNRVALCLWFFGNPGRFKMERFKFISGM